MGNKYGLKVLVISIILVIVVLILAIFFLGCVSENPARDVAKTLPSDTIKFSYFDLQTMRKDEDLNSLYMYFTLLNIYARGLGINIGDIDYYVENSVTVFGGDFDIEEVRAALAREGGVKGEYKGIEIWQGIGGGRSITTVAISGNKLIFGNKYAVKDCIDVLKGDRKSMYGIKDVKDVIERMPKGIAMKVSKEDFAKNTVVYGIVLMKENGNTLKLKTILKFKTEEDAKDYAEEISKELGQRSKVDKIFDIKIRRDGQFIEVEGKIKIKDWTWTKWPI